MFDGSKPFRPLGGCAGWGHSRPAGREFLFCLRVGRLAAAAGSQAATETDRLREAFWCQAQCFLQDPGRAGVAQSMLRVWGLGEPEVGRVPLGLFPSHRQMFSALSQAGFDTEQIRRSRLLADLRLCGRLLGAIRSRHGRIVSFWARSLAGQKPTYLYLCQRWKETVGAVGLDAALGAKAAGELLLVPDPVDAVLLRLLGMAEVAAIGSLGRDFTQSRWRQLSRQGVRAVTLLPHDDPAGRLGLQTALQTALQTPEAPELWWLPPGLVPGAVTAGELARRLGVEALRELLCRERVHSYRYRAEQILQRHWPGAQWTEASKRAALHEAIAFYTTANRGDSRRLDEQFVPVIVEGLGLDRDPSPSTPPPVPTSYCPMHRCEKTDCFCFD